MPHSAAKWGLTWKSTFAKTFPIFFGTKVGRKTIRDDFAPFFFKIDHFKFPPPGDCGDFGDFGDFWWLLLVMSPE